MIILNDLKMRGKEQIVFSDHLGRIQLLETVGEKQGRVYWRQNP